jgi:GNAT superfamily N-acetyltransferase
VSEVVHSQNGPGGTLAFRPAKAADLKDVVILKLKMFEDAGFSKRLAANVESLVYSHYQGLYADNLAIHFLAVADRQIVAMAGAFIKSDIPYCFFRNPHYGFIGDVYTRQEWRGKGLARRLSQEAIQWLRTQGMGEVHLLASEHGRPLYQSLGFVPSDEMVLRFDLLRDT